jgi:RNA polymerase sigma factor FliA
MLNAYSTVPITIDRDQLIQEHQSYVRALAVDILKGLPPHIELDELIASGNLGLVEAAERFDPRYRTSFRTFAYYRIRGAIYDALRSMGPLSRTDYARSRFAANANDVTQTLADDQLSAAERGATLDDEIEATQAAIDALIPVYLLSLDSEQVPEISDEGPDVLNRIEREELVSLTRAMVTELPDDDRQMLEALYFKSLSLSEVANQLGISKSWASRLHTRAIKHLREIMQKRGVLNAD